MIDYFDTPGAMTFDEVMDEVSVMKEQEALEYLAELASSVYSCPDKCDEWAVKTLDDIDMMLAEDQAERDFHNFHCG